MSEKFESSSASEKRTKNIPIKNPTEDADDSPSSVKKTEPAPTPKPHFQPDPTPPTQTQKGFQLNIAAAQSPADVLKESRTQKENGSPAKASRIVWPDRKISSRDFPQPHPPKNTTGKIWETFEWLATSAMLFMVAFFFINYQAYSTLFIDKLDHLRGKVSTTQFVPNITENHPASITQKPLPHVANAEQSKKQIPALNLAIAPPDDRIFLRRINKNVPIVTVSSENLIKRDWGALEADIQEALQGGVVHYPGTVEPGNHGNVVLTGHSSYFLWDPGRFKDVFALLHQVAIGDEIVVYHDQKKYVYKVYERKEVTPDKIEVLTQAGEDRLTLITCTPVGTNLRRLIVLARPVTIN